MVQTSEPLPSMAARSARVAATVVLPTPPEPTLTSTELCSMAALSGRHGARGSRRRGSTRCLRWRAAPERGDEQARHRHARGSLRAPSAARGSCLDWSRLADVRYRAQRGRGLLTAPGSSRRRRSAASMKPLSTTSRGRSFTRVVKRLVQLDGLVDRQLLGQRHQHRRASVAGSTRKSRIHFASFAMAPGGTVSSSTCGTEKKVMAWPVAGASMMMRSKRQPPSGRFSFRW